MNLTLKAESGSPASYFSSYGLGVVKARCSLCTDTRMSATHRTSHRHGEPMQFKLQDADSQTDDPHDVIVAQLRDLAPRLAPDPSGLNVLSPVSPEPAVEPLLRADPLNDNTADIRNLTPRTGGRRGTILVIVCAGIAAAAAWYSYGGEARQRVSDLVLQLIPGAVAPAQSAAEPQNTAPQAAASQPAADPAPAQEAAETAPTPQPATAPATAAVDAPPAQGVVPPEITQSIESMTREIASLKQTVEQLQAGQAQLSRDVAKATEHEARRKLTTQASKPAPPRPQRAPAVAQQSPTPYSPPTYSQRQPYPQGTAQREAYIPPPAPTQLPPQPGDTSVPRPPMPLR